ncbi:hypothetical protein AVEN_120239-1 [Araneus ventricosus]|uniref:Uncharacterized protein n=1 Tax=Araneus ventricosus TaxID=182803 RepID=A0A4Y2RN50_ARAVE|nr:hypothetical protein AVEN_120239-1 [Araneus ventricosus]
MSSSTCKKASGGHFPPRIPRISVFICHDLSLKVVHLAGRDVTVGIVIEPPEGVVDDDAWSIEDTEWETSAASPISTVSAELCVPELRWDLHCILLSLSTVHGPVSMFPAYCRRVDDDAWSQRHTSGDVCCAVHIQQCPLNCVFRKYLRLTCIVLAVS